VKVFTLGGLDAVCSEWFEYFGALVRTRDGSVTPFFGPYINYVKRVPLGVVGQITPWNHPLLIAIKKIAPALAAGNSVVVKPSVRPGPRVSTQGQREADQTLL
jgi:acyl-CoA reductase-like NAD-dependent aldehyde dehydrogenase